ncbi:MAG: DNA polymerase III subunit [Candidatus Omnitrophica bacterium]|nr:DNA polymerase III subunit [Candidatus Omnitrophota bacterium]
MSFNNIIGQDIAIRSLKNIISQDQIRGSYLFLGPSGVGKRSVSIEFAKVINCELKDKDACDRCSSCKRIDSMNYPDVFELYPEGASRSIKIDRIREVIYQASLKPYEGRKRVLIINNAEMTTEEAQNALLKLLEEPPENHIFILTVSNISGLLETVISRCKILKFYPLSQIRIHEFLQKDRKFDEVEAILFSHMAMGSLGEAINFKKKGMLLQREEALNDFFLRKTAILRENVLSKGVSEDVEDSLYMLLYWYRDLLVAKFTQEQEQFLNIDKFEQILSYSSRFSTEKLQKDLLNIMDTIGYIRGNINPKISLFNLAVSLKNN